MNILLGELMNKTVVQTIGNEWAEWLRDKALLRNAKPRHQLDTTPRGDVPDGMMDEDLAYFDASLNSLYATGYKTEVMCFWTYYATRSPAKAIAKEANVSVRTMYRNIKKITELALDRANDIKSYKGWHKNGTKIMAQKTV